MHVFRDPLRRAAGLGTAALLAAGCASPSSTGAPSAASPGATEIPGQAIVAAFLALTQDAHRSMHVEVDGSVTFGGELMTLRGVNDVSGPDQRGSMTIESAMIGDLSVQTVLVGGQTFTNTNDKGWQFAQDPINSVDPFAGFTAADVTFVGPTSAVGVVTYQLRLSDPVEAFIRAMGSTTGEALRDIVVKQASYDVVVDAGGQPISAEFTMSATAAQSGDFTASMRYQFSRWGDAFTIVAPIEVQPTPPPGTALTVYNRITIAIVVRDAAGTALTVPACSVGYASSFDTTRDFTVESTDGTLLDVAHPPSEWVTRYFGIASDRTELGPEPPTGELTPCADRVP